MEKKQLKETKRPTSTFRRSTFPNQGSSSSNTKVPSKGNLPTSSSISKGEEKKFSGDVMKRRCFKCQGVGHL